ncbi:MAG: ABC transporter substrate-binding protein [Stellaceae bacterium]
MKRILAIAALALFAMALSPPRSLARGTYGPGASDTEIKIGLTWPFSGPASPTVPLEREMAGYFAMVNAHGGVNGRKIVLIALDDGYNPAKTVEDTRRLVEEDHVLLMFGALGTPTNIAVRPYLNAHKVPQLFVTTGSTSLIDPRKYPWTMGFAASYALESKVFAKFILAKHPHAKIGILYQQDDFGTDHLGPFLKTLGAAAAKLVVAQASYGAMDATVTSQIISLHSAGANTLYLITQGRMAPQALATAREQMPPSTPILLPYVASAKSVAGRVGNKKLTGVISTTSSKDPTDPTWAGDPAVKAYLAWVKKYVPRQDWESDKAETDGYLPAEALVEVLRRCGNDLTRANVMKVATHLKNVSFPLLLPGITLSTSPTNYFPMHQMQLMRFNGTRWVLLGHPISE